jgi:lipopolysaccharide/colanic/teichoic acid biosynthesis glycosyltransferase
VSVTTDQDVITQGSSGKREEVRSHLVQRVVKSCLDFVGAAILIIVFSPIFVLVGALVALESGWPVIYRRRVVGSGKEFDAFKFRTMRPDADSVLASDPILRAEFERNFKLKKDPRLTRLGALLRRSSLDELPQLFNVLKGQMSLVGPRMVTAEELEKYGMFKAVRRAVKPGITGYWQVHGRQDVCYDERIRMDMYYLENWSLAMDLKILMKTPLKVLRKEGAY